MTRNAVFITILMLAAVTLVVGQERFVKPVDNAGQEASFLAFRKKLIAAAERKDAKFIYSILDPKIQLSFGGDEGIATFKRTWRLDKKNSDFWKEFLLAIKNGGSFIGEGRRRLTMFAAPYTHTDWPDDLDPFEHSVIFGNNVNLRERPATNARVIERLSNNVVKVDGEATVMANDVADWFKVTTLGGKSGWVKAEYVRSPIDFRAGFEKKRGVWKMIFFIAGD